MEEIGPDRIVYISCNPSTLARDIARFKSYKFIEATPVDMFPHTAHVETVVLLSKLCPEDNKIEITLDENDLYLTSAETRATYKELQEYVFNTYGVKVSTLYISQVRNKYGLPTGTHYNISKKEDAHVPTCPIEKEKLIVEALRHFQMIK